MESSKASLTHFYSSSILEPYAENSTIPGVYTTLVSGKKYYVSDTSVNNALIDKNERIYVCTMGAKNYFVVDNDEQAYPDHSFRTLIWKYAVEIPSKKEVEMTVNEIATLLRKNNLLDGELKIKE